MKETTFIMTTTTETSLRDIAQLERDGFDVMMHENIIVAKREL